MTDNDGKMMASRTIVIPVLFFLTTIALLCYPLNPRSETMPAYKTHFDQARLEYAKKTIDLYGDKIPKEAQKNILLQKIVIGMSPYEAKLAGGAFHYKVEHDPKVWPKDAVVDPLAVINKQSVAPDDSKIWMTFENETQFPSDGVQRFEVYFVHGKAQEIRKLTE